MDATKQKHIEFWRRQTELRAGAYHEGLTVFHPQPQPPKHPYPTPVKVSDSSEDITSRIKALSVILEKEMELALTILVTSARTIRDRQMRELVEANWQRAIREMDKTNREINYLFRLLELKRRSVSSW